MDLLKSSISCCEWIISTTKKIYVFWVPITFKPQIYIYFPPREQNPRRVTDNYHYCFVRVLFIAHRRGVGVYSFQRKGLDQFQVDIQSHIKNVMSAPAVLHYRPRHTIKMCLTPCGLSICIEKVEMYLLPTNQWWWLVLSADMFTVRQSSQIDYRTGCKQHLSLNRTDSEISSIFLAFTNSLASSAITKMISTNHVCREKALACIPKLKLQTNVD